MQTAHWIQSNPKVIAKQIWILTLANLKTRYRKTAAGFIWVILNPLILYGVQSLVFSHFLHLQVPNYQIFLLTGLLPWIFMVQTLEMSTPIFINNSSLIKAFPAHPLVYLAAQLLDNLFNFMAALTVLLIPFIASGHVDVRSMLLLPVNIFLLAGFAMSASWILATLQVFYRDVRYIISFGLNVSFFLTPVFYPIEFVPEPLRWIFYFNPFYVALKPFRASFLDFTWANYSQALGTSAILVLVFGTLSLVLWSKERTNFYYYV